LETIFDDPIKKSKNSSQKKPVHPPDIFIFFRMKDISDPSRAIFFTINERKNNIILGFLM